MIKIVAVDDNESYLESLKQRFEPHHDKFSLVYCFHQFKDEYNVEFMLKKLKNIQPDAILMDLSFVLTGQSADYGITLVRRILAQFPQQDIIMLVGDDEDDDEQRWTKIRRSFEAGAKAYLGKRDINSWQEAINDVIRGENYVNKEAVKTILNGLRAKVEGRLNLSQRQLEVLTYLAADKNQKQVAHLMKGKDGKTISIHTVNFHLRNIRAQLNCATIHGLIAKALRLKIIE